MTTWLRVTLLVFIAAGTLAMDAPTPSGAGEYGRSRRIELPSTPPAEPLEIAIQPGTASLLLFDAPLARDEMDLEDRERFRRVAVGADTVALVPSETFREGERLRLTVRFEPDATPAEARFLLVVVREHADTQVEVLRPPSAAPPAPTEAGERAQELQRLREENARLRAKPGASGLTGVITSPWMQDKGIAAKRLWRTAPQVTGANLEQVEAKSFRAQDRIAVKVTMTFPRSEHPWSVGGAALRDSRGQQPRIIQVWQSAPTAGDAPEVRIVVEAENDRKGRLGTYTLELREAGGDRTLTLGPVTFPDL